MEENETYKLYEIEVLDTKTGKINKYKKYCSDYDADQIRSIVGVLKKDGKKWIKFEEVN